MADDDKALHETLDLLSQVVASISDGLDKQSETLDPLAAAQAAASPTVWWVPPPPPCARHSYLTS